jgi:hypothetical protein
MGLENGFNKKLSQWKMLRIVVQFGCKMDGDLSTRNVTHVMAE